MKIGVVGSGTMGNGIAHAFAMHNYDVVVYDVDEKMLEKGISTIKNNLNRQLSKDKITKEIYDSTINNIMATTDKSNLADRELIIEAATEDINIKLSIFKELDELVTPDSILASNTSSISINKLADVTNRSENVIGMHFMNPVPIMKLVEVIKTERTSAKTLEKIVEISRSLNKYPVECLDSPGFVSNRILMPMINEAVYTLMEGVATKEAIDDIMKLGMAHPMGPLRLADLIGLDVCLSILNVLKEGFNDNPKYEPCPLLVEMCKKGKLGRKTGGGFYRY